MRLMKAVLWLTVILFGLGAKAQQINGHVVDEEGHPLVGVNVIVKKTQQGTITDENGSYELRGLASGKYKVNFSFVGFQPVEILVEVPMLKTHWDVTLHPVDNILEEVNVQEKAEEQRKRHASVSIETVNEDYIRENVGNSLMQTLEKLPGVNSMDVGAGFSKPILRGLAFNRVAVVENGIAQAGQEWGADHGLEIDQMNVEKVEVMKGPASLLYGSDAIGGVIVIKPPVAPQADLLETKIATVYKSNNQLFGTSAYVGTRKKKFFVRARFTGNWFADYKVPAEEYIYNSWKLPIYGRELKNTAGEEINGNLTLGWVTKWGKSTLTVSNVYQKMGFFSGSHGIPSVEKLERDGNSRDYDLPLQQVNHLKILSNTQLFLDNKSWYLDVAYQRNSRKEFSSPHTHGYEKMPDNDLELEFELQTFSGKIRQSITSAHKKLKFEYGLSAEHRNNEIGGYSFLIPAYQRNSAGAFAYVNAHLGEKVIVNGGARYDFGNYRIFEYQDIYIENLFPTDIDRQEFYRFRSKEMKQEFYDFSFGAGVSWLLSPAWNVKLNAGKSFRIPNVNELSANGVHHGSFRFERGDEDLTSEVAYQGDLVFSFQNERLEMSFTPYLNYFTNYIYLQPSGSFSDLPHAGQIYQFMQDKALRWGAEFSFAAELFKQFETRLNGEYIYGYNLNTEYALPMTPPANATVGVAYTFRKLTRVFRNFKLGIDYKMVTEQEETTVNELPTEGYQLLNAQLSSEVYLGKTKLMLAAQVRNILDTKYMNHVSFYRTIEVPEPGRNLVVSVQLPLNFSL